MDLAFLATINLVNSAWLTHNPSMYSTFSLVNGLAVSLTLLTWSAYFAFPEPKRRIIVLPTTSPFLRWNQISMALGDDPGYVAVGGIPPELFAPAELEVMRRASAKMTPALESSIRNALVVCVRTRAPAAQKKYKMAVPHGDGYFVFVEGDQFPIR